MIGTLDERQVTGEKPRRRTPDAYRRSKRAAPLRLPRKLKSVYVALSPECIAGLDKMLRTGLYGLTRSEGIRRMVDQAVREDPRSGVR